VVCFKRASQGFNGCPFIFGNQFMIMPVNIFQVSADSNIMHKYGEDAKLRKINKLEK
jgi:hypothetical protein